MAKTAVGSVASVAGSFREYAQKKAGAGTRFIAVGLSLIATVYALIALPAFSRQSATSLPPGPNLPPTPERAYSLLDSGGHLHARIEQTEFEQWRRWLHSCPTDSLNHRRLAAQLHILLGEYELDVREDPATALWHFQSARSLTSVSESFYGLAAFDIGATYLRLGDYERARQAFAYVGNPRKGLHGFSVNQAAQWQQFAITNIRYHNRNAKLGIPQMPHLDKKCGAHSIAAAFRAYNVPSDMATILKVTRVTGLGSNLNDLIAACEKVGLKARSVAADERGLQSLPKPLIAHVENDHWVAITKADAQGVIYDTCGMGEVCGKAGVRLTWGQWRAMSPGVYIAVTKPGSREEVALNSKLNGEPIKIATSTRQGFANLFGKIAPLVIGGPVPTCGNKAGSPTGPGRFMAGSDGTTAGGGSGPMSGDPTLLGVGEEVYSPGVDLGVYNPNGPGVSWRRSYRSHDPGGDYGPTSQSTDYGQGWTHGYHVGIYDRQLGFAPDVPQNGSGTFLAYRAATAPTGTWTVMKGNTVIATSVTPNGWDATYDANVPGGVALTVSAPSTAVVDTSNLVFGFAYSVTVSAGAAGNVWAGFDVVAAGSPGGATSATGAKSVYLMDGTQIDFTAPAVPTAMAPVVDCVTEPGIQLAIRWHYDSPENQAGYYTVTFPDGSSWVTTPALSTISCYPLERVLNRVGQGVKLRYAGYKRDWPLLLDISDITSSTVLLTVSRDSNGFITQVEDYYGRRVAYTPSMTGATTGSLIEVSQVHDASVTTPPFRFQYAYWLTNYTLPGTGGTVIQVPYLDTITVPSPTGTGTSTGRIYYEYSGLHRVTGIKDGLGNSRSRMYPYISFNGSWSVDNTVRIYSPGGIMESSYNIEFDGIGRKTWHSSGNFTAYYAYLDANHKYAPSRIILGDNGPSAGAILPGGTRRIPGNGGAGGPGYWLWSIWRNGVQISSGSDGAVNGDGWYVQYDITNDYFTVTAPASAAVSSNYEVHWTGYPGYTLYRSGTFAVAAPTNPILITYDSHGNTETVTNPRGITTTYTWDYTNFPLGRLMQVDVAGKPSTTFEYYEPSGLLKKVSGTLPNGGTGSVDYTYDSLGNVLTVTCPGNGTVSSITTTFNYTTDGAYSQSASVGQPLTVTDNLGHTTHLRYDGQGRTIAAWDALGNRTDINYDIYGQATSVLLPATGQHGIGRTTLTSEYLYTGGPMTRSRVYNEAGTQVRETNYAYNEEGANYRIWGDTIDTTYTFDCVGRIKSVQDGNGQITQYTYNIYTGNLDQITYPGTDTVSFPQYNSMGQPLQQVDGRGVVTNFTYDNRDGALTDVQYPAYPANDIAYTYDTYGRLTDVSNGEGTENYQYGSVDQLLSKTTTYTGLSAKTFSYAYNPNGSLNTLTTPAGSFSYVYDGAGRPTSMTNPAAETTAWTYLDNNWLATQTLSNGVVATNTYNALGQRTALVNSLSGSTLSQYVNMVHDGAGNRLTVDGTITGQTTLSGTTSWLYDTKNQLTQEQSGRQGGYTSTFACDSTGNLTTFKGVSRSYNTNNQRTGSGFTHDGNGNPTTYSGASLTFDVANHVTAFGSALTAGYRADGMRAWKQGSGGSGTRRYYLYEGATPVLELDASGAVSSVNTFGVAGLISRSSGGSSTFYTFDERGATAQRLNASGTVLSHHATDAYGAVASVGSFGSDPFVGLGAQSGYYRDDETSLVLCTFRYYDPANGRWLNRDPAGYGGGINLYGYCLGNPIMGLDPMGLSWEDNLGNWAEARKQDAFAILAPIDPRAAMSATSALGILQMPQRIAQGARALGAGDAEDILDAAESSTAGLRPSVTKGNPLNPGKGIPGLEDSTYRASQKKVEAGKVESLRTGIRNNDPFWLRPDYLTGFERPIRIVQDGPLAGVIVNGHLYS